MVSADEVGSSMAGPGIRYFEFAKALADRFEVVLLTPNQSDIKGDSFKIESFHQNQQSGTVGRYLKNKPIIISQNLGSKLLLKVRRSGARFIYDLYDPTIIEILEYAKGETEKKQKQLYGYSWATFSMHLAAADHLLCASDRQRDFYLGILSRQNIINSDLYKENPNLDDLISIVPFGLPDKPIIMTDKEAVENKYPAIKPNDKIVYWGGGVWNWFDALSVVKAIEMISKKRNDIKLVFAGMKHPNTKIKTMAMQQKVVDYCQKNQLENKFVFYNFGWTPYADRLDYLLRASIGISTHFDNLETRFSFRTRILDYLWADLPIVATRGDIFAKMIETHNLGKVVDYENVEEIAETIEELIDDDKKSVEIKKNIAKFKPNFSWSKCLDPVIDLIENDRYLAIRRSSPRFYLLVLNYLWAGFRKKYLN